MLSDEQACGPLIEGVTRGHTSQHNDLPLLQGQTRSVFSPASTRQMAASCSGRSRSMPRISRATRRASRRSSSAVYALRSPPAGATQLSRPDDASRPVVVADSRRLVVGRRVGDVAAKNVGTVVAGPGKPTPRRHAAALAARLTRAACMAWLQRIILRGRPAGGGFPGIAGRRSSSAW